MRVYHFSSTQHALNNIALRRIKVSRVSDLNDPYEYLGVNRQDPSLHDTFHTIKEGLDRDTGLVCFSKSWGNPVLWSHYGEKHRGICLGFDIPDKLLNSVNYLDTVPELDPNLTDDSVRCALLNKFIDWKYENEVRLFVGLNHDTVESGLYFQPFTEDIKLKEVILGPRCEVPIKSVERLISNYKSDISVIKSRISLTEFRVIEPLISPFRLPGAKTSWR